MPSQPKIYEVIRTERIRFLVLAHNKPAAENAVVTGFMSASQSPAVLRLGLDVVYSAEAVQLWHGPEEVS